MWSLSQVSSVALAGLTLKMFNSPSARMSSEQGLGGLLLAALDRGEVWGCKETSNKYKRF